MKKMKRIFAMLLVAAMILGTLTACGKSGTTDNSGSNTSTANGGDTTQTTQTTSLGIEPSPNKSKEPITLTVFSELANYSGEMKGWFATILKEKWNVTINLVSESEGVYETRMESGDLGDIVVWGSDGKNYQQAVQAGYLLDWNEDDLLEDYGKYIKDNMPYALEKNKNFNASTVLNVSTDEAPVLGFGHNVASDASNHEDFFYTWDIRWDLYEKLGHPQINNLDDLIKLFEDMQKLCPTDDNGNKTYAMSLWPDWDGNMVMYVKAFATAYYGYDEFELGLYDPSNGQFHDALEENGPYLTFLKFFNKLYQKGLLDPDSMSQTYNEMGEKVQNGGVFFSIFNYAGSMAFNNASHYEKNQIMRSLVPTEARPIVYGMSVYGGNRIWSIGSKTQYPEICMEIIEYCCTPEGRTTIDYGPKGLCWDYNEDGKCYLTDFGIQCKENRNTTMIPDEWGGCSFNDGAFQINNTTWSGSDINPATGERYNYDYWTSAMSTEPFCDADKDWREFNQVNDVQQYMEKTNYSVMYATQYGSSTRDTELDTYWSQVTDCIVKGSWNAIYAETDADYEKIVKEMKGKVKMYHYDDCVQWCLDEAARLNEMQAPLRK